MGNRQTVFSEEQLEDYTVRDWQKGWKETLINVRLSTVQPKGATPLLENQAF